MEDQLRAHERAWVSTPDDPHTAEAYDRACRRAGAPSPILARLTTTLRAAVRDAFDPNHLQTPCCKAPVWIGPSHVRSFVFSRPICCRDCTWSRHGTLSRGHTRQLGTLTLDIAPAFPALFQGAHYDPHFGAPHGYLRLDAPAPFPTRFVTALLDYNHLTNGRPTIVMSTLLDLPLVVLWRPYATLIPHSAPTISFGDASDAVEEHTIEVPDPSDVDPVLGAWFTQILGE